MEAKELNVAHYEPLCSRYSIIWGGGGELSHDVNKPWKAIVSPPPLPQNFCIHPYSKGIFWFSIHLSFILLFHAIPISFEFSSLDPTNLDKEKLTVTWDKILSTENQKISNLVMLECKTCSWTFNDL